MENCSNQMTWKPKSHSAAKRYVRQVSGLLNELQRVSEVEEDGDKVDRMIEYCRKVVRSDLGMPLLGMVQCLPRDPENGFAPVVSSGTSESLVQLSDIALVLLSEICSVVVLALQARGWHGVDSGSVAGSVMYEHVDDGRMTEDPELREDESWEDQVLRSFSILCAPSLDDAGKVRWAMKVVDFNHKRLTVDDENPIETNFSIADVLQRDEAGDSAIIRCLFISPWKGLYSKPSGEWDLSKPIGEHLENWTATSTAGIIKMVKHQKILRVGLHDAGVLAAFLKSHLDYCDILILEESEELIQSVREHFGFCLPVELVEPGQACARFSSLRRQFDVVSISRESLRKAIDTPNPASLVKTFAQCAKEDGVVVFEIGLDESTSLRMTTTLRGSFEKVGVFGEYELREHGDETEFLAVCTERPSQLNITVETWQAACVPLTDMSGAMDVSRAKNTMVIRHRQFLSEQEIASLRKVSEFPNLGEEVRSPDDRIWTVKFLQSKGIFAKELPDLRKRIIRLAMDTARKEGWFSFESEYDLNVRVAEFHEMCVGGTLPDPKHYDLDSCITVDMMLSNPDSDFEGGDLQTEESNGDMLKHEFERGDALVFVSHKAHCVCQVSRGTRNVFVVELWKGPERNCGHRCEIFHGRCPLDMGVHAEQADGKRNDGKTLPFRLGAVESGGVFHGIPFHRLLWEPRSATSTEVAQNDEEGAKKRHEEVMSLFD